MAKSSVLEKKATRQVLFATDAKNRTYTNEEVQNIKEIYKDYLQIQNAKETLPFEVSYRAALGTLPKMRKYSYVFKSEIKKLSDLCEE